MNRNSLKIIHYEHLCIIQTNLYRNLNSFIFQIRISFFHFQFDNMVNIFIYIHIFIFEIKISHIHFQLDNIVDIFIFIFPIMYFFYKFYL